MQAFHVQSAFNSRNSENYNLGIYRKINLPSAEIGLIVFEVNQKFFGLNVSNVQFELDFSLEDKSNTFITEAKVVTVKTFSPLQLFLPLSYP